MTITELRHEPQQRRAVSTVDTIVHAALEVLAADGRDRFTTQNVANTAGVSIGTVYRYFPDRVALLDRIWPDRDRPVVVNAEAYELAQQIVQPSAMLDLPPEYVKDLVRELLQAIASAPTPPAPVGDDA